MVEKCRNKVSKIQMNVYNWICPFCNNVFRTRRLLTEHKKICDLNKNKTVQRYIIDENGKRRLAPGCHAWNKGLTEETDDRVKENRNTWRENLSLGKFKPANKDKHLSKEHKQAISESMKIAHKEGRAHNIGESRWNNEHSYPEKWLIKVLENEFGMKENIDYKTEMPFYRYSLDFAWPEKRLCIEIDGKQHIEDVKQIERDKNKDILLHNNGWKELRVSWSYIYNNSKEFINKVKEFLNDVGNVNIPSYKTNKEKIEENKIKRIELRNKILEERKMLILNTGIDLNKFGSIEEISSITGLSRRIIYLTIKHFPQLKE